MRFPPLLVTILLFVAMLLVSFFVAEQTLVFIQRILAVVMLVFVTAVVLIAAWQFRRANTTVDPRQPSRSSQLVTTGVFNWSRNPMYVAFVVALVALALWLGPAIWLIMPYGLWWYLNRWQIPAEEQSLAVLFTERYERYCQQTPRWW